MLSGPVVARWGTDDPAAPLIVLLHGRGASENSMIQLAPYLPPGPAYAAVRGPVEDGGGFAWFVNESAGRPDAESLAAGMSGFREWLDAEGDPDRPVVLLGFSNGAALAGGLLLSDPGRYDSGVLLYGTLPFDAGVPLTRGRLAGLPIFLTHGLHDTVIRPELQERTWEYLLKESGCALWAEREPTGHELTGRTVGGVAQWLGERLAWLRGHGPVERPSDGTASWPTLPGGVLPERAGPAPEVSVTTPQQQESQNAEPALQEALYDRLVRLEAVTSAPSAVSVPGARGFVLAPADARGPDDAFMLPTAREFAHLHPEHDGSLHVALPTALAFDALAKGWAVAHPLGGIHVAPGVVMIFGPRDDAELDVVTGIVAAGHAYASGAS